MIKTILRAIAIGCLSISAGFTTARPLFIIDSEQPIDTWRQAGIDVINSRCPESLDGPACIPTIASALAPSQQANLLTSASYASDVIDALHKLDDSAVFHQLFILATKPLSINTEKKYLKPLASAVTVFTNPELDRSISVSARRYVAALRRQGVDARLMILPAVHKALFDINRKKSVLVDLVKLIDQQPAGSNRFANIMLATYQWQQPIWDNRAFLKQFAYIKRYPADSGFHKTLAYFYRRDPYLLTQYEMKSYLGFSLTKYRQKIAKKQGLNAAQLRYLQLQSKYGNQLVLDLARYADYEPVIVVGIDDEKNTYRSPVFYQTVRQYTWKETSPTKMSVRPLGAFLHFRKPLPRDLAIPLIKRSALAFDAITYFETDPLQIIDKLPDKVAEIVRANCVHCHQTNRIGGSTGHLVAASGKKQGGLALPLENYPLTVMKAFLFDQQRVAKKIGVSPNAIDQQYAVALYEWAEQNQR